MSGCLGDDASREQANASDDAAAASGRSPYVGEELRIIKSLSESDVQALLNGEGHGYAKAAELNRYPGPAHVLDLRDELALSEAQAEAVEDIHARMKETAMALGHDLVAAEADLDALFASGDADEARIDALTREIGLIEGELRASHLQAHRETRALLTHEQVLRYDELRGYAGGGDVHDHRH